MIQESTPVGSCEVRIHFDIVVLGGGPAGSVTGLCLARMGWKVGIFEATAFDRQRHGETLPPEINPVLRRLGFWEVFLAQTPLESPGIVSTWGSGRPVESDFIRNAFGCGWHIDRNRFDQMVAEQAVAAGAELFLKCNPTWMRGDGKWEAEGIDADFVVDAAGRHGAPVSRAASRIREDELVVIAIRISNGDRKSKDQRTWIETAPTGWWYSTPLPDGSALAMFFTGAEIYRTLGISIGDELRSAPMARARLEGRGGAATSVIYVPTGRRRELFGDSWLLVGDSASSYDPLSGRGIFKALRHGEAAARAINATLRGDRGALTTYAEQVSREFHTYALQRQDFYSGERRWVELPFWAARSKPLSY